MKFYETIKSNSWLSVESVLLELYPGENKNLSGYEEVYQKLKMLQPEETNFSIRMRWEKDDFDQTDYVNVSGCKNKSKEFPDDIPNSYALDFTPWNEWLGMDIDKDTLQTFSELEIIAHCLYEMTFIGFEEDEIKAELDKIISAAEEIENMTEKERQEKLKSWEDIKIEWDEEGNESNSES